MSASDLDLLSLSAMVVSAYVDHNRVPQGELVSLIEKTHTAMTSLGTEARPAQVQPPEKLVPAVPIKKSVTPDAIYSLEDGRPFKSLKRHLRTAYDMTPEEY